MTNTSLYLIYTEGGHHLETGLTGVVVGVDVTSSKKIWNTFQALGNIAFAYAFSMVFVEIQVSNVKQNYANSKIKKMNYDFVLLQDTLKSNPPENQTMKKATVTGISITTLFYALCGLLGYAAFGNNAPGNFLTGFGFYEPFWLVDIGNLFIIIHLVGAYQVFAQPVFSAVESWGSKRWPQSKFMTKEYNARIPLVGTWRMNMLRVIWRTIYVLITTLIAIIFPFFNSIVGLLGAVTFFPLTVYFPIEMYLTQAKVVKYSSTWIGMKLLNGFCLIVSLVAAVGSIQGIVSELETYTPFK